MWKLIRFAITLIFLSFLALALFMYTGSIPDIKVVAGHELSDSAIEDIRQAGIIEPAETIEYYYSEDLLDFHRYGNLFTRQRVISYETDEESDELFVYSAHFEEITDLQFHPAQEELEDSTITVYVGEDAEFLLIVSPEEGGDKVFFDALSQRWQQVRSGQ